MPERARVADVVVARLRAAGVRTLFGMPGGGSSTDVIEAAGRAGLPFVLAHTENAAGFMACAQAERTGDPGACLTTLGPGAASVANATAHAYLDRVPLLVLTDRNPASASYAQHQDFDQAALFAPITKRSVRLAATGAAAAIDDALAVARAWPPGPVHVDCGPDVSAALAEAPAAVETRKGASPPAGAATISRDVEALARGARRPVALVGLAARSSAPAVRAFCERTGMPALVTYKAKGVIPDGHPAFAGILTNGALERGVLDQADLFVAIGLDPVELIPRPWAGRQPIIACQTGPLAQRHLPIAAELDGELAASLAALSGVFDALDYLAGWAGREAERQRAAMRVDSSGAGLAPFRVVEAAARAFTGAIVTVDAGAHMFPAVSLWPVTEPSGLLISNGLSTMGFALPSAIGAAALDRSREVVALTGDGGLFMCLAELRTAVRERARVRVVVFDDEALSLIKIKQLDRRYPTAGVDMGRTDWCGIAVGMGMSAYAAVDEAGLATALAAAASRDGPALVDATVDPSVYPATMRALRG